MIRTRSHIGIALLALIVLLPLTGFVARQYHEHVGMFDGHTGADHAHLHAHDGAGEPADHDHTPVRVFLLAHAWLGGRCLADVIPVTVTADAVDGPDYRVRIDLDARGSGIGLPIASTTFHSPPTPLLRQAANLPPPASA